MFVCRALEKVLRTPSNSHRLVNSLRVRGVTVSTQEPTDSTDSQPIYTEKDDATSQAETPREAEDGEKMRQLEEQVQQLDDKYKRSLAETENIRQMYRKQIDDAKLFGIQSFAKDLIDVADTLELATESMKSNSLVQGNEDMKKLYDGVEMTTGLLQQVFARNGLIRTNPVGAKFDPNFHEAMFYQEVEGKTPGSIAMVMKTGYLLHGRTLRAAQVGVVKDKS